MKNYFCINGQKIEMTEEQVKKFQKSLGVSNVKLADIDVGKTFKIGEYEFIVLEQSRDTTAVILKDLLFDSKKFGENNNYQGSYIDELCNKFGNEIANIIGQDNLVKHTVDLISDDGLKCYGKTKRRMSLLTANLYRRYVEILDNYKVNNWWWLATPYSTPKHGYSSTVKCVSPSGYVNDYYYYDGFGVRPFCILNSYIFVSK